MRKSAYVVLAIVLIGFGTAHAGDRDSRWLSENDPVAKHITAMEKLWAQTECGPQRQAIRDAVAGDFQGTSTKGQRYGRNEALEPGHDHDCQLGEIKIRLFGEFLAIAYGSESRISQRQNGAKWKRCQIWTDTWLKRDGQWQVIAAQDNLKPCD